MTSFVDELSMALFEAIAYKFNENHDELGRFASGDSGGGGTSEGSSVPYIMSDSPTANITNDLIQDTYKIPSSHTDGINKISFVEQQYIVTMSAATGTQTEAYGAYNPMSRNIQLSSNKDNIKMIGGAVVIHEIGHNVQLAKLTDDAESKWEKISNNGEHCSVSAYGRTNQGEHFAEAYRAYARGGHFRSTLKATEPDTYSFMQKQVFQGKGLLPEGQYKSYQTEEDWMKRYDPRQVK